MPDTKASLASLALAFYAFRLALRLRAQLPLANGLLTVVKSDVVEPTVVPKIEPVATHAQLMRQQVVEALSQLQV